jgi:hypothetical protein
MQVMVTAGSILLAMLFIVSGIGKIRGGRLLADLAGYQLLPQALLRPVSLTLPGFEVLVGVGFLHSVTMPAASVAATTLLSCFTVAIIINLARRRAIACGCRGSSRRIRWRLVAENLAFTSIALSCLLSSPPGLIDYATAPTGVSRAAPAVLILLLVMTGYRALIGWVDELDDSHRLDVTRTAS